MLRPSWLQAGGVAATDPLDRVRRLLWPMFTEREMRWLMFVRHLYRQGYFRNDCAAPADVAGQEQTRQR